MALRGFVPQPIYAATSCRENGRNIYANGCMISPFCSCRGSPEFVRELPPAKPYAVPRHVRQIPFMKYIPDILNKIIVDPVRNNLVATMFISGLLLLLLGTVFDNLVVSWIPERSAEFISKTGEAILGAGVFAVILKTSQFTEIFQKYIYEAMYSPVNLKGRESVLERWGHLTRELLKDLLPASHDKATGLLQNQFFNGDSAYHFESHNISYLVEQDRTRSMLTITCTTNSTIVLSPASGSPVFKHTVSLHSPMEDCPIPELVALRFNGKVVDEKTSPELVTCSKDKININIPLNEYADSRSDGDLAVKMERTVKWHQDARTEPFLAGDITRYIKGAVISVKAPKGWKVVFKRFGLGEIPSDHYLQNDGLGFERWTLALPNDLLLPGQGYMIILLQPIGDDTMQECSTETI